MYDIIIVNGKIITGEGNPWFHGDVAVVKDKVVRIGRLERAQAAQVIDARGCFVCPGFIDGHTHSDLFILAEPKAEPKVMQGVTTDNLGLDGMSLAPIQERDIPLWRKHLSGLPPVIHEDLEGQTFPFRCRLEWSQGCRRTFKKIEIFVLQLYRAGFYLGKVKEIVELGKQIGSGSAYTSESFFLILSSIVEQHIG